MAAARPEVVVTLASIEIIEKFQKLSPCFPGRRFQWNSCQHHATYDMWSVGLFQVDLYRVLPVSGLHLEFSGVDVSRTVSARIPLESATTKT